MESDNSLQRKKVYYLNPDQPLMKTGYPPLK